MSDPSIKPKSYKDFNGCRRLIKRLIDSWESVRLETERLRNFRYSRGLDSEQLRNEGVVKADEGFYPIRLIDQNIRREAPQYVAYLTQSTRAVIFRNVDGTSVPLSDQLESDFTNKVRYGSDWEKPFLKLIDGTQFLGWAGIETVLDIDKPGHFAHEYVAHEDFIFSLECRNYQDQEICLRRLEMTEIRLKENIEKYGFNAEEVDKLLKSRSDKESFDELDLTHTIYKVYFREDGVVNVAYYNESGQDWLRAPQPLYLGRSDFSKPKTQNGTDANNMPIMEYPPLYENLFPVHLFFYIESEDPKQTMVKGRGALDEATQEAVSAVQSGYVNGINRASNIYASPAVDPMSKIGTFAEPKQTNVVLKHGLIYDRPINFFHTPYPDGKVGEAVTQLLQINERETNQVNYSVIGQPNSKTATEVSAATQEASKLSSVQTTQASIAFREIYSADWLIYQNRVAQGKIILKNEMLRSYFYTVDEMGNIILKNYSIRSSGDVDIVQKAQKLQSQKELWPLVSTTPIGILFLMDILVTAFPEEAPKYIAALKQQKVDTTDKLAQLVNQLAVDPNTGTIRPELQGMEPALQQLGQQVNTLKAINIEGAKNGEPSSY